MEKGVSVKDLDSAGGPLLSVKQHFVFVDGKEWIVKGDPVTPHGVHTAEPAGVPVPPPEADQTAYTQYLADYAAWQASEAAAAVHDTASMAEGDSWITINGIPACHKLHLATCGDVATGRPWIVVND